MNYLSFNGVVFNAFLDSFNWDILSEMLLEDLRNVLSLVFDSVVVSYEFLTRDLDYLSDFFIFVVSLFVRNIFDSTLTLDSRLLNDRLNN